MRDPLAQRMMTINQFGNAVLDVLQKHLNLGKVTFRGSFASGTVDEYSDVDLQAEVHEELTQEFFDGIVECLQSHFGPLSLRYDPEHKDDRMAQGLRINFHAFPVFWRVDLNITSDRDAPQKWPSPFPDWSIATSAFWNVAWAVKRAKRGKSDADHYMVCACEKLGRPKLDYSQENALLLLSELSQIADVDGVLISKLENEIGCQQPPAAYATRAPLRLNVGQHNKGIRPMIEIKPMDEKYIHLTCLHEGPIDSAKWTPSWNIDPRDLPPHPWSDETIVELAAAHGGGITHGNCKNPAGREFLREMTQRYGTCAILACEGQTVVGQLRFYPMKVARLIAVNQPGPTDPSPVLDCTAACEPEEDERTLWIQCVMTCAPYKNSEGRREVGARKGIGLKLAKALIAWAEKRQWKRIVKVAHCDLDWFYGIQGGGGKTFWEKAGFRVVGSFYKRAWEFDEQDKATIETQMAEKGMTDDDVWTWYRMMCEL